MKKININYKELLKTIVIILLVLGYVVFLPLYFGLTIMFKSEWSIVTNVVSFICFLIQFIVAFCAIVCLSKNKIKRSIQQLILFILICALPLAVFPAEESYCSNFTLNKWEKKVEARFLMVNDMLEKNKLIGKDKNEILELLGNETPSEGVHVTIPKDDTYEDHLVYYLGKSVDGLFNSVEDFLVIYFNNNVVEEHKILTENFEF